MVTAKITLGEFVSQAPNHPYIEINRGPVDGWMEVIEYENNFDSVKVEFGEHDFVTYQIDETIEVCWVEE